MTKDDKVDIGILLLRLQYPEPYPIYEALYYEDCTLPPVRVPDVSLAQVCEYIYREHGIGVRSKVRWDKGEAVFVSYAEYPGGGGIELSGRTGDMGSLVAYVVKATLRHIVHSREGVHGFL